MDAYIAAYLGERPKSPAQLSVPETNATLPILKRMDAGWWVEFKNFGKKVSRLSFTKNRFARCGSVRVWDHVINVVVCTLHVKASNGNGTCHFSFCPSSHLAGPSRRFSVPAIHTPSVVVPAGRLLVEGMNADKVIIRVLLFF